MSGDMRGDMDSSPQSLPPMGVRKLGNGRQSPTSPLKIFGHAKKKINDIYVEIFNYIYETNDFVHSIGQEDDIIGEESRQQVTQYMDKVQGIQEMLSRDRMKVVFFGRTSNGKSTVINTMLKNKILPTGIGHTTNCFLQVEGSDTSEAYLLTSDSDTPKSIQSISQLANALSEVKLECKNIIRICWPKNKCSLLRDDIVLVDSPGIDVDPDLDGWIDAVCLDADVFVLVANAESTLMQAEKNFFHKVSGKLSKPNIFILNNRWDASALEPENMEMVRQQHTERCVEFLADELGVVTHHEANDRVFFVSAREALISRVNQETGTPTPSGQLLEGFQGRLFEFCNFERKFEECISQSAVETKFAQHADNGKSITSDLRATMDDIRDSSTHKKDTSRQDHMETTDKLDYTEKQLNLLISEIKEKIKLMTEEVDRKVATALTEEIRRLMTIVDEFDRPFHPDPLLLAVYKKELHAHVEAGLGRNLQTRCSLALSTAVEAAQQDMTERLLALLPEESRQQTANLVPMHDFEVAYRLDCRNLCADFQEDIQFKFSFGITALMNRFLGPKQTKSVLMGYGDVIPRSISSTPQTPSNEVMHNQPQSRENEMILAMLGTFSSLYSRTTIGALAVTGVVAKGAGWRVIGVCGAIYGLLYVYERLTWTKRAMERTFKKQYVEYATSKLKLIIDLTSSNCSHQVLQELSSTFARLCHLVDNTKHDLKDNLDKLNSEIDKLDEIANRASYYRNKAIYLDTELNGFIHQYIKPDSRL